MLAIVGVSSDILTCRCRHCGQNFPYLRSQAGAQAECPECRGMVQLPGQLQAVASKKRMRRHSPAGLALEIGGFLLMLLYPIGTVVGFIAVVMGWRKSNQWCCTSCGQPLAQAKAPRCAHCRAVFVAE